LLALIISVVIEITVRTNQGLLSPSLAGGNPLTASLPLVTKRPPEIQQG